MRLEAWSELGDAAFVFFRPDAAGAVDEPPAGGDVRGGVVEDGDLDFGERSERCLVLRIASFRTAGEHAAVAAWSVDEHAVERLGYFSGQLL